MESLTRQNAAAYLFLGPWLVGFSVVTLVPFVSSLYLAFTNYELFTTPRWIGFRNFIEMFLEDERFAHALKVTFLYVGVGVPLELAFALGLALLLNRGLRGLSFYRAVYYIPYLFGSSVAIAILWRKVFGIDGFINQFLSLLGVQGISWIGTPSTAIYTLVLLKVWQFGSPMIIFLAGLRQIPQEMYDAASIDGAGKWGRFRYVTMPLLSPILFFNLIMQMVYSFQAFTPAYIVSDGTGGPADATLFYTLYLYEKGFTQFHMGYASAMAWFLLVVIACWTAVGFLTSKKWVYYEQ
ncbi:MAG: ABC transporter permease [Candidatus Reconcilbacillus cellulovorans]|uniref:ABC transporter permease n=1 Tax=Candidatus Reconcilbacillus cellulovorans TaxID=1906605 RepID=A0A2A6DZ40_9BACL|nr:MAG: ABC transporter permease [Candidatus Reconcilbacillus cellulovorans]